ncbi:hypothetical protein [Plantactinospora endophytica]|uniref:hypothetical protein n=1 Tax=Plantactinospora endophytica TaxID=673535 RepID=UPI001945004B|nr:hypothetical protein [Plantactinospora endophytica]
MQNGRIYVGQDASGLSAVPSVDDLLLGHVVGPAGAGQLVGQVVEARLRYAMRKGDILGEARHTDQRNSPHAYILGMRHADHAGSHSGRLSSTGAAPN